MFDELWDPVTGTYKIQPGDNLTEISKELEVPIDSLVSFNNLSNPDDIKVGQTLLYRREPGFLDYLSRAFGKGKMNESINNKINANIKDVSKLEQESLSSFFNLGKSSDLTNYLKENHNIDLYTNTENLNTLYKFFRDKNWSRNQTLAILSSIIAESGGDPYKKQIGGSGYGLLQYTDPARKQMMLNYKSKKYPNNELLRQAEFIDLELRGDKSVMPKGQYRQWLGNNGAYYKEFNNPNTSLDRLTSIITTSYIRPGKPHLSRRINLTNVLDNIVSKNYNPNLIAENRFGGIISKKQSGGEITAIMGGLGTAANLAGGIWGIVDSFKNKQYPQALQGIGNVLGQGASMAGMFAEDGGKITKGEKGLDVSTIKVDPSIFTSWNAIKLDPIEIKREEAPGFNMADYLFKDVARNYDLTSNKKSTKDTSNDSENTASEEEKPNNIEKINLEKDNQVKPNNTYYNYNKSKWIQDLSESYKKAGITNPEALKYLLAQDALESGWGKSAQSQFNYGNLTTGSSWKGKYVQGRDKDANGNPISQKFRSYNSIDEYAKDKVEFLTRLYDFNQNDDFSTFISKLTGNNKGHRRYAEARNYGESLSSVFKSLINKHQEGGILLFGNPETSEMLTYKMPDGSIKTIPNPGVGFISGTDPVGQVVVEGAVLNKPLGWISGKTINWAKNLLSKRNMAAGNFSKGEEVVSNGSEKIVKKEDLPSYAKPNWQGDSVELTKDRLRDGGFDRLEQSTVEIINNPFEYNLKDSGDGIKFISPKYSVKTRNKILQSRPKNYSSKDANRKSRNVGYGEPNGSLNNSNNWGIFNDAPSKYLDNPQIRSDVNAHEFSHWVYYPKYGPSEKYFDYTNLPTSLRSRGEFAGRGTQLKNYFGLKEGEELTGDMLKYAKENFAKDRGYDNHMVDFLDRIKDFDKVAKWLNTFSASIIPITIYNGNNK